MGIVVLRYLLAVEPLASMPAEQVVATYAPVIQGYLSGPLALGAPAGWAVTWLPFASSESVTELTAALGQVRAGR